jgi:hypothetical protein
MLSTLRVEIKYLMCSESYKYENKLGVELDGISTGKYFLKTLSDSYDWEYRKIAVGL